MGLRWFTSTHPNRVLIESVYSISWGGHVKGRTAGRPAFRRDGRPSTFCPIGWSGEEMVGASDARLVARVRTGDRDAAEALARRYLAASRALALALLGCADCNSPLSSSVR